MIYIGMRFTNTLTNKLGAQPTAYVGNNKGYQEPKQSWEERRNNERII